MQHLGLARLSHSGRYALSSCVAAAMLAGCGGSQPPIGVLGAAPQTSAVARHADRGKSWMLPEAKSKDLLYVSTSDSVYVFSYPKGTLVGTLTGFDYPRGLCSDRLGNVWVANASTESGEGYLVEYAHGGMTPIATLSDTGESPVACSIDPSTGNLAAANCPDRDCASTVAIYARAQGTPTQIPTGPVWGPFEITYDNSGNIFVAAEIDFFDHKIGWLPNGQSQFQIFTMEPKTLSSGNVAWDGTYVAVLKKRDRIHRYTIVSGHGQAAGPAVLLDGCCGYSPMLIKGSTFISAYGNNVSFWHYPQGGASFKSISVPEAPYGVAVSVASSR
ncbi:MAG: hypothetical protein WB526_01185 [Candidatus Cybelea sp.]